jgi:hypothetical protein
VHAQSVRKHYSPGAATAYQIGMDVSCSKIHACTPKGSGSNPSLGCCLGKTCSRQRATVKRHPLGCNICSENKFHQRSSWQKASTVACWSLTVAPKCHSPCCSWRPLAALWIFESSPVPSSIKLKPIETTHPAEKYREAPDTAGS